VQLAVDGSAALELLQRAAESERPYDIAIIDRQMPSMDGEQLARTIRSRTMLAGTRLGCTNAGDGRAPGHGRVAAPGGEQRSSYSHLALTANALPDELQRCLQSGMDDCLTKPIDATRLKQIVDRHRPTVSHQVVWGQVLQFSSTAGPGA
jgi:CheY-like chemotaxis protein